MKAGVVIFPGSNCDQDTIYTLSEIYRLQTVALWHKDTDLQGCDIIFLPGGFSYGDYLRSGAVARFSPIMESVIKYANTGGLLVGICNGFQVLCEAHLLPGALMRNIRQKFICKNVYIKAETNNSLFTSGTPLEKALKIPIAHAEGRYYTDEATLQSLQKNEQILFRYCDENARITEEANPNGSLANIAGICNAGRNIFGLMPHPERAADPALGNTDGCFIFDSIFSRVLA